MRCRIRKNGSSGLESLTIGERVVARDGKLICLLENRSEYETRRVLREEEFISCIASVTLEQSGPVRAVVKVEGTHQSSESGRGWLPYTIRLYFYAGVETI